MPAIIPSLNLTGSNITFTLASTDPLRLISNISVAAAALSLIFALRSVIRYRRKRFLERRTTDPADQGKALPQYISSGNWQRSREVSNAVLTDMSAYQKFISTALEAEAEPESVYNVEKELRKTRSTTGLHTDGFGSQHEVYLKQHLRSHPPLPLSLTPPLPASRVITFEQQQSGRAQPVTGDLDGGFFDQPNPDYASASTLTQPQDIPMIPRKGSYARILPLEPPQPVSWLDEDGSVVNFFPNSFPTSSPTLPQAPDESFHTHDNIDLDGGVISALDSFGAGWKRHTRVYGGGVCLACMAAPEREGGFYGARVRPEERR